MVQVSLSSQPRKTGTYSSGKERLLETRSSVLLSVPLSVSIGRLSSLTSLLARSRQTSAISKQLLVLLEQSRRFCVWSVA